MFRTLHLHARIRAICTFSFCMTLLLLFPQKAAAWSELLVKGSLRGNDNWTTIATLTQGSDANKWSGTIDASSWKSGDQLSFKLYDSKDDNKEYWWGNTGTAADMTTNPSVTLYNVNTSGNNMTLMHNTAYSSYTLNCSYSDAGWTIIITGVKSSTGGAPLLQLTSPVSISMAPISEQPVQKTSCTISLFARTTLNITSPSMRDISSSAFRNMALAIPTSHLHGTANHLPSHILMPMEISLLSVHQSITH